MLSYSKMLRLRHTLNKSLCRYKYGSSSKKKQKSKVLNKDKALEHFDEFYGNVYSNSWPSIRLGLLSENKYCALVNNYSDVDRIVSFLEEQGAMSVEKIMEAQRKKINENKKSHSRKKELNAVYDLDRKMDMVSEAKKEEELSSIYSSSQATYSLNESPSLNLPSDRYIEPSPGVSASSLYEFIPPSELKGKEDWVLESDHYAMYSTDQDFPVKKVKEDIIQFPPHLQYYTFESGNVTRFPQPRKGTTGVSDYFLLDGGSILPVLALGIQPGDNVLDMCAAPGGKSLSCLQTLCLNSLTCNDQSESRMKRLKRVMNEFLYDFDDKLQSKAINLLVQDGRLLDGVDKYNKILVDVPCTTDKHSVMEEDNNVFKPTRLKERLKIPEVQSELLVNALKLVQPGGSVVYSTCSLSPVQNDGVVHMALRHIWQETDFDISVVDLQRALEPASLIFKFGKKFKMRYGHLVLPYLPANFGPMYFCKLIKNK